MTQPSDPDTDDDMKPEALLRDALSKMGEVLHSLKDSVERDKVALAHDKVESAWSRLAEQGKLPHRIARPK